MGNKNKSENPSTLSMSLGDHLDELRSRITLALVGFVLAFVVCLFFGKSVIAFIQMPYTSIAGEETKLVTLSPAEVVVSYMRISLISALIVSSPWVFYQLWMFIGAGLYPKEKRAIRMAVPFSVILFILGALFFLLIVAPICIRFFLKFHSMLGLTPNWTLNYYVSFISMLMLVFGLAFQMPILIFFLNKAGLVSLQALYASRKYVLLGIVILAAMVTPPDVISQVTLAIPLYILFELGIFLSYLSSRKKKAE